MRHDGAHTAMPKSVQWPNSSAGYLAQWAKTSFAPTVYSTFIEYLVGASLVCTVS